jgi:hypothetical protein
MCTEPNRPNLFRFTSTDGLRVACARWDSPGPVLGIVQIAHGLGEHIGRCAGLIEYFVQAGFLVYSNDHRGHGHTARSPKDLGDFGRGRFDRAARTQSESGSRVYDPFCRDTALRALRISPTTSIPADGTRCSMRSTATGFVRISSVGSSRFSPKHLGLRRTFSTQVNS